MGMHDLLPSVLPPATNKCSRLLFHGSYLEFKVPRPLTHFGSRAAAVAAPGFRGTLMAFEVTIYNPLRAEDSPGGADHWQWLRSAVEQGVVSEAEFEAWERRPTGEGLVALLASKGFDGIVYRNQYEDAGVDSWVVFWGEQAVRVPLPELVR